MQFRVVADSLCAAVPGDQGALIGEGLGIGGRRIDDLAQAPVAFGVRVGIFQVFSQIVYLAGIVRQITKLRGVIALSVDVLPIAPPHHEGPGIGAAVVIFTEDRSVRIIRLRRDIKQRRARHIQAPAS